MSRRLSRLSDTDKYSSIGARDSGLTSTSIPHTLPRARSTEPGNREGGTLVASTERDSSNPLPVAPIDGQTLLQLGRAGSTETLELLRRHSPEALAGALRRLTPAERMEFLETAERVDEIVPLLSEAEFTSTVRGAGIEENGWLVEFASPEQRIAAVDLDCWKDLRFSPRRLFEWLDAMIEAGPETLAASFFELDEELWVLAMRAMGEFSILGLDGGDGGDGMTIDGLVYYDAHSAESEDRIAEILRTALLYAPSQYWRLVYGAVAGGVAESTHFATRWHRNRLNDLGFPDRGQAQRAYAPLEVDEIAALDASPSGSSAAVVGAPEHLPEHHGGSLLGRALAALPPHRIHSVMTAILAVANALAVADRLPLAEPDSIERSLAKARRGIELGLAELSRSQNRPADVVLDATPALDLFRMGATLARDLRPTVVMANPSEEEDALDDIRGDWGIETERISEADQTVGSDGRPNHS
jgi:hypothetical protein